MSKPTKTPKPKTEANEASTALVLPRVVHVLLDAADRGQSTALSVLQDARAEVRIAVDGGIDLAEKLAGAAFRFVRKTTLRLDEAGADALTEIERLLDGAIQSARETTNAVSERVTSNAAPAAEAVRAA